MIASDTAGRWTKYGNGTNAEQGWCGVDSGKPGETSYSVMMWVSGGVSRCDFCHGYARATLQRETNTNRKPDWCKPKRRNRRLERRPFEVKQWQSRHRAATKERRRNRRRQRKEAR